MRPMRLTDAPPWDARPLMSEERDALLGLLRGLARDAWASPTPCPGWSVQDVVAHVLGEDLGLLARARDGHDGVRIPAGLPYRAFVGALNDANQRWVEAARRLSPRQLVDLLSRTGDELAEHLAGVDMKAPASVVWTGPDPVPAWFDVARHYTERWVHQQQVREAVGRPGLDGDREVGAVLRTFVWALASVPPAEPGAEVGFSVTGQGGGEWALASTGAGWELVAGAPRAPDAVIRLSAGHAWRLFTDALEDLSVIEITGNLELARSFLDARAIIV